MSIFSKMIKKTNTAMNFRNKFVEYNNMKRSVVTFLSINILALFIVSGLAAQDKKEGICFMPEDKEHEECIDFKNSWYYSVSMPTGWVIHVRKVNSKATAYIWDRGQYLVSLEEWKKVASALSSQGLSTVCPPPEYRPLEDQLKTRDEICKK